MSALNIVKLREVLHVVSDGCYYDSDGQILALGAKVWPLAHFPGFVAVTGRMATGPGLAVALSQANVSTIDEMVDRIEELLPGFDGYFEGAYGAGVSTAAFGGWSESRGEMVAGFINGSACSHSEPYKLTLLQGETIISTPPLSEPTQIAAFGAPFFGVRDALPVERYARIQIAAQRQMKFPLPSGREGHGIGGFAQVTTVTREGVSSRVLARWNEDQVGGYVESGPVDYQALRSDGPDPTAGMSRLQRDVYLRKQAKQRRVS